MEDGFRYNDFALDGWPKRITLHIYRPLSRASLAEIEKGTYDTLWIDADDLLGIEQIAQLRPDLERLRIQSPGTIEVGWISSLGSLRYLQLHGKIRGELDFDALTHLQTVDVFYCPAVAALLDSGIRPAQVSLHGLDKPLTEFPVDFCREIALLGLDWGKLVSLDGIQRFESLVSLSLLDMRLLENIEALSHCQDLEELDVTACNKIIDCSCIGTLERLEWLVWENRELESLRCFLPGSSIEVIRLGGRTEIRDGDTSVALEFPNLKHVSFKNRRRYKSRVQELNRLLKERNPAPFRTLAQRQLDRLKD